MAEIRAITIQQPWAWAVAHGGKTIENRNWGLAYRGPIAIHAGLTWSEDGGRDARVLNALRGTDALTQTGLARGAVVALADLVDEHPDAGCCRPWGQPGEHHLVLANVRPLGEPLPCRGALGLWQLPTAIADRLTAGGGDRG